MDRRPQEPAERIPAGAPGTAVEWSTFLESRLNYPVGVVFGRSRTYPIQVRPPKPGRPSRSALVVRMHSMFADAPIEVAESVARWIRSGKRASHASALLDRWIEERSAELPARKVAPEKLVQYGREYDLERLARELLAGPLAADFPEGTPVPNLTWGRRGPSRTRRSLRLGSFDLEAGLVRLHPVLDQAAVPEWFVRYVLFHELLHAAIPPVRGKGSRWVHHGPEFRRREHAFEDHARALVWEQKHLPELIRSARADKPITVKTGLQRLFRF